jgi:hypothetical protein
VKKFSHRASWFVGSNDRVRFAYNCVLYASRGRREKIVY